MTCEILPDVTPAEVVSAASLHNGVFDLNKLGVVAAFVANADREIV